jgi:hypothetical protein
MKKVAFDESGNTGQNLLDPNQPVFVLASVHLNPEQIATIFQAGNILSNTEIHYVKLARSDAGRQSILNMLATGIINSKTTAIAVYHKKYMIVAKIIDMLVEELAHLNGIDLYERGANQALCNLWFNTMPVFCGQILFDQLLATFVQAVRKKNPESISNFYRTVDQMYHAANDDFKKDIEKLRATNIVAENIFKNAEVTYLDPAIPSFVQLAAYWSTHFGEKYTIVHDSSKPIKHAKATLECYMAEDEQEVTVGYDRRKFVLPLKADGIFFEDSLDSQDIQVADLVASSVATLLKGIVDPSRRNNFWEKLKSLPLLELVQSPVWPSLDVTPEQLGTVEVGGINAADYTADLLRRQQMKRGNNRKDD